MAAAPAISATTMAKYHHPSVGMPLAAIALTTMR
jgi:hypothetical protein